MNAAKITACFVLTMAISGVFMAPPRNVIQMEENPAENFEAQQEQKKPSIEDSKPADHQDETLNTLLEEKKLVVNDINPVEHLKETLNKLIEEKSVEQLNIPLEEKKLAVNDIKPADHLEDEPVERFNFPPPGNKLSVEDLKPVDHMDAVKLEQDGMLNKDYKKEIFLGDHEEIEDDSVDVAESKIKDIFAKVDVDSDNRLCAEELLDWIVTKTNEHFDEALQENDHIFKHMDPDNDGYVDWKEYYVHFLLAKGYPMERAKRHVIDYDDIELDFEEREQLIRYKFKWTESDVDPMDNKLTKTEFLAFRHPEQSEPALRNMVDTIMDSLDKNDDRILTEEEFVILPLGDVDDEEQKLMDKHWQKERSDEFINQIDFDHDSKVTIEELKRYIDPKNPDSAKSDMKLLLEEMDDDKDHCISWNEIDNHMDMFIQSKIVNIKKILHDEF